jgi:hypothetical protein
LLRDHFKSSEHYKRVYRKDSFDSWPFAIGVLRDWKVLVEGVDAEFLTLGEVRNRSLHFNPETYQSVREDALTSLQRLNAIISSQFGIGTQRWFIENTSGAQFVKREYETHPFVRTYLVPVSGFVGPYYGMHLAQQRHWVHLDYADYGDDELSDEEFAKQYQERDPAKVVSLELIEKHHGGPLGGSA